MLDYHVHTNFSIDSDANIESVIESAISKEIKEIAITDHMDYDCKDPELDTQRYVLKINELIEKYKDKITIVKGVELGLQPHILDWCEDYLKKYDFNFVIGSIHVVKKLDLYWDDYALNRSKEQCFSEYLSELHYCVKNSSAYSVIGHFDVIRRYIYSVDRSFPLSEYFDVTNEIFKILIQKGKGIEINTSGLRHNLGSTLPPMKFVKRFRELGGEIITIGSDAHKASDVGYGFKVATEIAKESGFNYITSFKTGTPTFIKI